MLLSDFESYNSSVNDSTRQIIEQAVANALFFQKRFVRVLRKLFAISFQNYSFGQTFQNTCYYVDYVFALTFEKSIIVYLS